MVPNKKYDVNCFEEENIYLDEKICHHVGQHYDFDIDYPNCCLCSMRNEPKNIVDCLLQANNASLSGRLLRATSRHTRRTGFASFAATWTVSWSLFVIEEAIGIHWTCRLLQLSLPILGFCQTA